MLALIVVDVQNDFCPGGALAVAGGDEIVAQINNRMADFDAVILTQDWHPAGHSSFASSHKADVFSSVEMPYGPQVLWPDHCVQGSFGAAFHKDLATDRADLILRKGYRPGIDSYSAFFENDRSTATGLEGYLTTRGVRDVTDPIVRSLIDNDFYKLLMCQSVLRNHPKTEVTFSLINRSSDIRLAELIDEGELREQLDHVRSLSLSRGESTWMRGNTFYGKRQMFTPEFMDWFEALRLPDYHLEKRDGQYELTFQGSWPEVMLWEIPALAVLMELRGRAVLRDMRRFELQILYARAMAKLWEKIERLRDIEDLRLADFGTRRRHSFLWQDWAVQAMTEGLGDKFIGTSNCLIAKNRDLAAIGTNAHELPMIYSALASDDQALRQAPYDVLSDWHEEHDGNLRIILPDTYGTEGFLDNAPDWLATWTGMRIDSGDPIQGAEHAIKWWKSRNEDPSQKLLIFSDGLDVEKIAELHRLFAGRVRVSFGWGTLLTNDFRGLVPNDGLKPFSLVCKAVSANGKPTVKLSDNPNKAMGPADEIARYKQVFEVGRQNPQSVIV